MIRSLPPMSYIVVTSFERPVVFDEISFRGDEPSRDQIWKPPVEAEPSFPMRRGPAGEE